MSTVIKANAAHLAPQAAAFNFDDMSKQAQGYLDKVRAEAEKIVVQAQHEAVRIRQQAEEEGRAAGQKAVQQLTAEQVERQMATVLPALRQAITAVEQAKHHWLEHWQRQSVRLAAGIAERVIRRELSRQPEITLQLVREGLELAAGRPLVELHVNPGDHEVLAGQLELLVREFGRLSEITLIADSGIAAGGCRVETRHGVIDLDVQTQLARIENELN